MLSIVIPALNAESTLATMLGSLGAAEDLVVVDGGSTDATVAIAETAGARVISAPRGRGSQLGAGAKAALGDWLLFVHADTCLSQGWPTAVERHIRKAPGRAACFQLKLDDPAWQARVIERGVSARVRFLGLPYGDQGLLVSRRVYERVGGYRPLPLMEDVDLVRRLPRPRVLAADAITSAERWRRDGWATRSARNLMCLGLYRLGVPIERIARTYARPSI